MQNGNTIAWHTREVASIITALNTNVATGLSGGQVLQLQKRFGKNILESDVRFTLIKSIVKQLLAPLSLVLVLALVVTLVLAAYTDAVVIVMALAINLVIGALQEGKSAKVFEALARSSSTSTTVMRGGTKVTIDAEELVPGDVVYLEGGHKVPADLRLVAANDLRINESALTGEWRAVDKYVELVAMHDTPLSAQSNMAFMGTVVSEGHGHGIVVATGSEAHFGSLAQSTVGVSNTKTPLSKSINALANNIVGIIGVAIALIFVIGLLRGGSVVDMLLLAVAVAVAAMPEGLPAAVTVTLAVAMEAVMKRGGLVKNLMAAETLGTATVILTDKTGTLTRGIMQMAQIHTSAAAVKPDGAEADALEVLKMAVLASDAFIEGSDEDGLPIVHGRPLEQAIVEGALLAGLRQDELFKSGNARQEFLQFEASRRYAVSLNESAGGGTSKLYITGSPEHILSHATHYVQNGERALLTDAVRQQFKDIQEVLSSEGKRFTAVAYRESSEGVIPQDVKTPEEGESLGFVFGGLLSFSDSVRVDVPEAIATAKGAGIQVIMVTGDHGETAKAVAREVGLNDANILLGSEVAELADEALVLAVKNGNIFARMLPEQKLRLATVLKEHGEVVAMTGDGINDAPALIAANIGIAQGSGTDVAKEAADMVLTTGSFSVIITAIEQGRRALSNLRKIISYLLSTSASEIVLIGGAVLVGLPLPLLPAQILWANIVGEGFMSFPFAFEPAERGIMQKKPEKHSNAGALLSHGFDKLILFISFATGVTLLTLYVVLNTMGISIDELRTVMFTAMSFNIILLAFSFKNLHKPLWHTNIFSNVYLLGGFTISLVILAASLMWAPLMALLSLTALSAVDILLLLLLGLANIVVVEFAKYLFTNKQ